MGLTRKETEAIYIEILEKAASIGNFQATSRDMALNDLYFLLVYILNRPDMKKDWLFDRIREVEKNPNGYLDIWAREHYKSSIVTFGLTIQDILNDPEVTIGIFSLTRPIAKGFLRQIKLELQDNTTLHELFPDVLYSNPEHEAPKWSEDDGLIVKRKTNPNAATLEAWGLVDAMPTSKHFKIRVYDDIIDERNVGSPEMIAKALKAWELSLNLGSTAPMKRYRDINIQRYSGTRYHMNDPYQTIMKRGSAVPRIYPGTEDGTPEGKPVLWTSEFMAQKRRDMGSYVFGAQILCNPVADEVQGFRPEWRRYWKREDWSEMNIYLLCDPANEKKKENDYTVMLVIGLGADRNYYLIDGLRDRINLTERAKALIRFHREYEPIAVGYEKYGKDSDIETITEKMEDENYRFDIISLGGNMPKRDRIRKIIPDCEAGRWYVPAYLYYKTIQGKQGNLTAEMFDEEDFFPFGTHDDILDCRARIKAPELGAVFPMGGRDIQRMSSYRHQVKAVYNPYARLEARGGM